MSRPTRPPRIGVGVAGATASNEAIDSIVDLDARLVERMAAAFDGRDPADPELLDELAERRRLRVSDK